jgi:geranylgeranyl pyrophosphate synthase
MAAYSRDLPLMQGIDSHLFAAVRYVLDRPGSLVRARMAFRVATAFGMEAVAAQSLATALEYFHTASLIFDDLPCMDDASMRRGVACVHRKYGEHEAILAALALINRAYALAWQSIAESPRSARQHGMEFLEDCLGVHGLLNGQSLDLNYALLPHTRETTERIAHGKTVSLIRLALVWPALLAGATEREQRLLERISTFWGLAYQIADDLKDVLQSVQQSGKSAARDALLDRPNLAAAIGIRKASIRLARLIRAGDGTLGALLRLRPSLIFLSALRSDLQADLEQVMSHAGPMEAGVWP